MRTKLFVSYSHRDQHWLDRLKTHLALLERNGVVHVWSDTRIGIGGRWKEEINKALAESRIAVLLVSPDFLASEFVWREEMTEIVRHRDQKDGLIILPLIVRPCAWRLAPELAALQARPRDGHALALGQESDIDSYLADFVYELATRVEQLPEELPEALANAESNSIRSWITKPAAMKSGPVADASKLENVEVAQPIVKGQEWIGEYFPTNRKLSLLVQNQKGAEFSGRIHYDDRSQTLMEGRLLSAGVHPLQQQLIEEVRVRHGVVKYEYTVAFKETEIAVRGDRAPTLNGDYVGVLSGTEIAGIYSSDGKIIGNFVLSLRRP